jgi:hypothetical protein
MRRRNSHRSKTRRYSLVIIPADSVLFLSCLEDRDVHRLLGSFAEDHPYIRVHNEFWKTFGGANVVLISVEAVDGDIFDRGSRKGKKLTELIERTPGANNYQIFSIARQKVKDVRATAWGIEVQPVMWPGCSQARGDGAAA